MGRWVWRRLWAAVLAALLCGRVAALDSLAGDADCDGFALPDDLVVIIGEIFDDAGADSVEEGGVFSCSGVDANGDGMISAADLVASARLSSGDDGSLGPWITFFGVAAADGTVTRAIPGRVVPLYQRPGRLGFHLVVEAVPGASRLPVGQRLFNARVNDPMARPDLQIQFGRELGAGSPNVCDENGVPRMFPPNFGPSQQVANLLNDVSCRFRVVANPALSCTVDALGVHRFAHSQTRAQFCLAVSGAEAFSLGTTLVTARVLDIDGNPGPPAQILVHVGTEPLPTARPTVTPTFTRGPSATPTFTREPTRTPGPATATPTRTLTRTRTGTAAPLATPTRTSRTPSSTPTRTRTATPTRTRTPTVGFTPGTPTRTRPASATPTPTRTPTQSRTRTQTLTPSVTRTPTQSRTATRTRTPSRTPTSSSTPTITRTPTVTRTPGPTARPGPEVNFIGLVRPDDRLLEPSGTAPDGASIYERRFGYGFNLVIEGKPGPSRRPVGRSAFNYVPGNPNVLPDLQVIVSRGLGANPSRAVCDNIPGFIGGVPASPGFDGSQAVADAMNDLGCRFVDGDNRPLGRSSAEACVLYPDGEFRFARSDSTVQFCAQISVPLAFPVGDTRVTARLRDTSGETGPAASIIVRVSP